MTTTLQEFGDLIADKGLQTAIKLKDEFTISIRDSYNIHPDNEKDIIVTFAFMNLFVASGVWSKIDNQKLRRDLMEIAKKALIIRLAQFFGKGRDNNTVAFESVNLDFDLFRPYAAFHLKRLSELNNSGVTPDANSTLLIALEWLQSKMNWTDSFMNQVIPLFTQKTELLNDFETLASQLNKAAKARKKKSFLSRLFSS